MINIKESLKLPDKIFGIDSSLLTLFLPPFVLVLVFLISLNLVLIPKANEIESVNKKISEMKTNTDEVNKQVQYLVSIDQEKLQKNAEYLDNAVLKDKKSYLLVEIIREVANKFDYQVESFSLTPGELKNEETKNVSTLENMVKMPISLTLSGPKSDSLELISALEKTLPILFIDKFETKTTGDISNLDLTVYSYYINGGTSTDTENIALSDLILSSEEAELVEKISAFTKIGENINVGTSEFQQYQRENPFTL